MNGQHSEQVNRAWGPTAAAAVVACLPPAAMATSLGCAGFGLAMDNTTVAASGAVAATVGMVAQRSAGRRLRRRLRQERARNRLELHDLEVRLDQATRHLAEAVALAEAATRAMSGAPLVLTAEGAVVAKTLSPAAQAALVAQSVHVAQSVDVAQPVAVEVADSVEPVERVTRPVMEPAAVRIAEPVTVPAAEADTEIIEAVPAVPVAYADAAEHLDLPNREPVLARRVAAAAVSEHLKDAARVNAEVAARITDPVFGQPVVPATPADLFTPANGLPVPSVEPEDLDWFAPRRAGGGLPPAPLSPAVGISLPVGAGPSSGQMSVPSSPASSSPAPSSPAPSSSAVSSPVPAAAISSLVPSSSVASSLQLVGHGLPPGQREPVSGALMLVGAPGRLPARLADARVVDLSRLAHPESSGLIVVRRGGKHAAPRVAADHVA